MTDAYEVKMGNALYKNLLDSLIDTNLQNLLRSHIRH